MCPVCCALVCTVTACSISSPHPPPPPLKYACQMDSLSARGWVAACVPVCLTAQHCSGGRDSRALSYTADFTRSRSFSCLPPQPSLCRSLATPPPIPTHFTPCSAPEPAFSPLHCSHLLTPESIDLQSECVDSGRVDILQRVTLREERDGRFRVMKVRKRQESEARDSGETLGKRETRRIQAACV